MNEILHTKWGNAKIDNQGYYRITSSKQGNYRKFLHRLIWEDFYGCKIPNGYVIHHKNKNKLDNCVLNLQLMRKTDHDKLHKSEGNHPNCGSNFPIEHRLNISKSRNTTGYFRVCKEENKGVKQGFVWRYKYYKNGKSKSFVSVSLKTLEERVKAKGLEWRKL